MTEFEAYLRLGFSHITDLNGYDHILFIVALCIIYQFREWKKVLILVTAFTVGHSITLALATLNMVRFRSDIIEFLIPVTIVLTAVGNLFNNPKTTGRLTDEKTPKLRYGMALLFGLIHGLGFSNYLRSLLGKEASIFQPLLAFNIGLEIGQLAIVFVVLCLAVVFQNILKVSRRDWILIVSGIVIGFAITLLIKTNIF
ncbi:HupE/UreJ family protein [Rhodocytophaga aerolata]|uniref:HupE/UreJ family protein n=1 Tax=Rhodocytophaga aerolata TaxID=455078 RepID=A0ABT8QYE3_9BACT|nr:HupE/UreJ family protein [Rhodocytophaga aerolata]MDO1444860.1 HupE/UreJ family protein [Rhodocytophaga aerolata]